MKIYEITTPQQGAQQASQKVVKKVNGNKAELEDPNTPGVTTTVDLDKTDVDTDNKGNTVIDTQKTGVGGSKIKPNTKVTMQ